MTDTIYQAKNPIATFVNELGETRIIHRPKGSGLRVLNPNNSVALRLNRAAAKLIGERIRAARIARGMTLDALGVKAGLKGNPVKNYVFAIERGARQEGIRFGTLYAIALALECQAGDLIPCPKEVAAVAGVAFAAQVALS